MMRNEKEEEGELVGIMINIALLLPTPLLSSLFSPGGWWQRALIYHPTTPTHVPIFEHGGEWWIRLSAQVYVGMEEFVRVGEVVREVCEKVGDGRAEREVEEYERERKYGKV
ncbi:hypothetical protein JCM8547_008183 [Rhodosporidiobolus lusitaniae]